MPDPLATDASHDIGERFDRLVRDKALTPSEIHALAAGALLHVLSNLIKFQTDGSESRQAIDQMLRGRQRVRNACRDLDHLDGLAFAFDLAIRLLHASNDEAAQAVKVF